MSTELVAGIRSRENPDHMTSPTSQYRGPYSIIEDYGLEVSITTKLIRRAIARSAAASC
jgi:hypothetical protein